MNFAEKILSGACAIVLVAVLCFSVFGENGLMELGRLQEKYDRAVEANEKIALENKRLAREIDRLNKDLGYVEGLARRELGYVYEEEVVFKSGAKAR